MASAPRHRRDTVPFAQAALAALSIMSTLISLFAITQCSGSTPETIYASLARAGAFVHFFSVLWWQTLVMLGLVSVAVWLRSGWLGGLWFPKRISYGVMSFCVKPKFCSIQGQVGETTS